MKFITFTMNEVLSLATSNKAALVIEIVTSKLNAIVINSDQSAASLVIDRDYPVTPVVYAGYTQSPAHVAMCSYVDGTSDPVILDQFSFDTSSSVVVKRQSP